MINILWEYKYPTQWVFFHVFLGFISTISSIPIIFYFYFFLLTSIPFIYTDDFFNESQRVLTNESLKSLPWVAMRTVLVGLVEMISKDSALRG